MKRLRVIVIAVALATVSIGLGAASAIDRNSEQEPAFCQRCGDGYCAKSCENAQTCPQDCAPSGGSTAH